MAAQSNSERIRKIRAAHGITSRINRSPERVIDEADSTTQTANDSKIEALRAKYEALLADKDAEIAMLRERLRSQ